MLEELKAVLAAATPGEWKPCREHEDFDGPMFDIDEWEKSEYEARPFVRISAASRRVTNNHDLFTFDEADARLICLLKNNAEALIEAVEALRLLIEEGDAHGLTLGRVALAQLNS